MKSLIAILLLACASLLWPAINFDTLSNNGWAQQPTSGQSPDFGADVHWACDTAGYAYMFGGCTYQNGAGGTHNNDVYRYNLMTGACTRLSNCSNNAFNYLGGCQAPHAYDSKRNCVWTSSGFSSTCGVGMSGLLKFQCPNGPLTQINTTGGGHYFAYDPVNDLVYRPNSSDGGISIYNPNTNTWSNVAYPGDDHGIQSFAVPCCVDTKRGLFIMAMWCDYNETNFMNSVWIFNGATKTWAVKTPPTHPTYYAGNISVELAYDTLNDKCLYFGLQNSGCVSELWAYDYPANTWTQMPMNGRSFNAANKAASTWPPAKNCMTWSYSPKFNAFACWGGGAWVSGSCTDYGNVQPLWYYRYAKAGTSIEAKTVTTHQPMLSVSPNPFMASTRISVRIENPALASKVSARVYDISGKLMKNLLAEKGVGEVYFSWEAEKNVDGIYLLKVMLPGKQLTHKLVVSR